MVDTEKLENLPFKQGRKAYLVEKHGNLYRLKKFDHPWQRSLKEDNYWYISKRIIQNNIGKSFKMAFSYFCKNYPKYWQSKFLKQFQPNCRGSYGYYIDEQGNIQEIKYQKKKYPISIQSADYKEEMFNKLTGKKIDHLEIKRYNKNGKHSYHAFGLKHGRYIKDWYDIDKNNVEYKVTSGWIKYYESKQDREFKRLMSEKIKAIKKKSPKKVMSDEEYRAILKAKVLKDKEETRIKLEAKGMRPNAFTAIKTDTNV